MTREEAVSFLRRYRRTVYRYRGTNIFFFKRDIVLKKCVYGQYLITELIRKIRGSDRDPIEIVSEVYSKLDEILGDSDDDHFETHRFAAIVENEAGDILRYLRLMKRKENEDDEH